MSQNDLVAKLATEKCHCGNPIMVHKNMNSDGSDFTRGLCSYCDAVRCDAYPGACNNTEGGACVC